LIQVSAGTLGRQVKRSKRGAWYLVYDGDCRFCARSIALLASWDRAKRLKFVPFQDAAELARLPFIPREALEQAMQLVSPDDAVFAGAAALPPMLRLLPMGRAVSWIFAVPGVSLAASKLYRILARNRHKLGCGSTTCSLGG
jgi:predicted DCC family thiol-disulfide oxidoreductase YuxK